MPVDPASLPHTQANRYANVDTSNIAAGAEMDREQLLFMGSLASDRGEKDAANEWRMMALRHAQAEEVAYQREQLEQMRKPKATVPAGTQLVERQDDSPWAQDSEYQELADRVATAESVLNDTMANHPDFSERSVEVGRLRQLRDDRAQLVRQEALASGAWTETDEVQRAAKASLDEKADRVAIMFKTGRTS